MSRDRSVAAQLTLRERSALRRAARALHVSVSAVVREMFHRAAQLIASGEELENRLKVKDTRGLELTVVKVLVSVREMTKFEKVAGVVDASLSDTVRILAGELVRGAARFKSGQWLVDPDLQFSASHLPPMPGPDAVEVEFDGVKVGRIGLLSCVTEVRGRRYHLTREFSYRDRGEAAATRIVLAGLVRTTPGGATTHAMGVVRVTSVNPNGLVTVERLPDDYVYGWLDSQAHGSIRRCYPSYDKDYQAHLVIDRGKPLDHFRPENLTCHACVRWHKIMKKRIECAERDGMYRMRLSRPCLAHGRRDVCVKWFKDGSRGLYTSCARPQLGIGPGDKILRDDWDGVPPEEREIEYEDVGYDG